MTGLLIKKYHVAILENDEHGFVNKVVEALKSWYSDRIVIHTFDDTHDLFEAVNINKATNKPFDMAVLGAEKMAERMVLQHSNPALKIVMCQDETGLKRDCLSALL